MRYMLILLGLLWVSTASAMDCEKVPTCEELGYSTEDDPYCADNGYMFCPFNHDYKKCVQYNCEKLGFTEDDKTSWCGKLAKCKGNPRMTLCQNLCEVGDVYYDDGTCGYAKDYDPNDKTKIPVGVVFYVTDEGRHGKVTALRLARALNKHAYEPSNEGATITILPYGPYVAGISSDKKEEYDGKIIAGFKSLDPVVCDGKAHTKILAQYKSSSEQCKSLAETSREYEVNCQCTAAKRSYLYYPEESLKDNPKVGQYQWYLPSSCEMMLLWGTDPDKVDAFSGTSGAIGDVWKIIDQTLTLLSQKGINVERGTNHHWTTNARTFGLITGDRGYDHNHRSFPARPMLQF